MIIRIEEKKDNFVVENLTREAFWNIYNPGCVEHYLVHQARFSSSFLKDLSLVVEIKGQVVAHIMYSKVKIINDIEERHDFLCFGPVSVLPEYQNQGIGMNLINYSLKRAEELGYKAVFITGDPNYYKRFGFVPCSSYNIFLEKEEEDAPYFMVKELKKDSLRSVKGKLIFPKFYYPNEKDVEDFDKNFPKKIKNFDKKYMLN